MNSRVLQILEFEKIKDKLKSYCASTLGKTMVDVMPIYDDVISVQRALEETGEAHQSIVKNGNPPIYGVYEVRELLRFVEKGGSLTPQSLLDIADGLRAASAMNEYGKTMPVEGRLKDKTTLLGIYPWIIRAVEKSIVSADEISDDASPALRQIRRSIQIKEDSIREKLQSIIHSKAYEGQLQEQLITVREGRYVVPIRAEYKNRFQGVVHDQSGSGQTAYMEPLAVVKLNNDLRTLEGEEQEEIRRILRELSNMVLEEKDGIINNQDLMQSLDFAFAKAKMALEMDGNKPIPSEDSIIRLNNAKHPLLKVKKVVPINIELGANFSTLVITGPNTGGKTVTLKTVGLLQLMAQSGLFIPAEEGSKVGIFEEIFADIGDEQSIEQSLSTFSSHMINIVKIFSNLKSKNLVLLDELGAGTDPMEGAALAMAILEQLRVKGIFTIATTHYSQLKTYALTTECVRNASVEFDIKSLSPTYRLIIGTPGKSNAFEISKRLGLSVEMIEQAKKYIGEEERKMENLFANLEEDRLQMEQNKALLIKNKKEIEDLKNKLAEEVNKNKETRDKILEKAREEAKAVILETKAYSDELIRTLKNLDKLSAKDRARSIQRISQDLRRKEQEYRQEESAFLTKKTDSVIKDLKLGEEVEIITMGQRGFVVSLPDNQNNVMVQVGILKINTDLNTLRRVSVIQAQESSSTIGNVFREKAKIQLSNELDLRGKNVEEGILDIEKYLDDAAIVGLKEVQIIHGKGTGMLRKGLQEYLRKHPHVKSIRDGKFDEGGMGVTVVKLK